MMRAALYLRRSTEEHQADSLQVQEGSARQFAANGENNAIRERVTVVSVFSDDGISRAEFVKRPGLIAMLNAAERGDFEVVICRDDDRLGGDMYRAGLFIQNLLDADVRLFYYASDQEVRLDGPEAKLMMAVKGYASELERAKTSARTRENLAGKARRGVNAGGKAYGYECVRGSDGADLKVAETEAVVVRWVFEACAKGMGYRPIAKDLNARRVPPPRAGRRGTGSWSPSQIRNMLSNERYRGVLIWGRVAKRYKKGTKVWTQTPETTWTRVERPDLRIVPEELWQAVQQRFSRNREIYGQDGPKNGAGHLLSGLARCGQCGGPIHRELAKVGGRSRHVYYCAWRRDRGPTVCSNSVRRPVEVVDATITDWIRRTVLSERVIEAVLGEVRRRLHERADNSAPEVERLKQEASKLRAEIRNGAEALLTMGHSPAVAQAISDREARLASVEALIAAAEVAPDVIDFELRQMEAESRGRLEELSGLLGDNPAEGRRVLETILAGPLTFSPIGEKGERRFEIAGRARTAPGVVLITSPRGSDQHPVRRLILAELDQSVELPRVAA